MREIPRRSRARPLLLATALVAMGACTPLLDPRDRPPPCDMDHGYTLCDVTGTCLQAAEKCPSGINMRQSGTVFVKAPGVRSLNDISASGVPGDRLVLTPGRDDQGTLGVQVTAKPGTSLGPRQIKIESIVGGMSVERKITVFVSAITAGGLDGKDSNDGTLGSPFSSFSKAATSAGEGDTIQLLNNLGSDKTPAPPLPKGITVMSISTSAKPGQPATRTKVGTTVMRTNTETTGSVHVQDAEVVPVTVSTAIQLAGDASLRDLILTGPQITIAAPGSQVTLTNVTITGKNLNITAPGSQVTLTNVAITNTRLDIEAPGSHVVLSSVTDNRGLTIGKQAGVPAGAPGTTVEISGHSSLGNNGAPMQSPVLVEADGAKVILPDSATAIARSPGTSGETIRLDGNATTLEIRGTVGFLENIDDAPVIRATKATTLNVTGARFLDPVEVDDSHSEATFNTVSFVKAPFVFSGRSLNIVNGTDLGDSPLIFSGQTLKVQDTMVHADKGGMGIIQMPPAGSTATATVLLTNVTVTNAPLSFNAADLKIDGATSFTTAPVTFSGDSLSVDGAAFRDSLLTFHGRSLFAKDTVFERQGIVQDLAESTGALQNVTIADYTQFGYHLMMGKLDVENSFFQRSAAVPAGDGSTAPWALLVDTPRDPESSSVSSQGTIYDTTPFAPQPCAVSGQNAAYKNVYRITQNASISFCGSN